MLHTLVIGFDSLAETIGAIFVKELCDDGDRLVNLGLGCHFGDIDDNLSVEDLLLDTFIEVVGYGPDEDPLRKVTNLEIVARSPRGKPSGLWTAYKEKSL